MYPVREMVLLVVPVLDLEVEPVTDGCLYPDEADFEESLDEVWYWDAFELAW